MVHHGVHIAAHHQKAQSRLAQRTDGIGILPVRLGNDAHLIPRRLQHAADDGVAEGRMIHIGVTDDIDEVALLPAALLHVLF